MKKWIFTYGALMNSQRQESLLGKIPNQCEFILLNSQRIWNLAVPYELIDHEHDSYIPPNLTPGKCPTYFNIIEKKNSYVVGKALEVEEKDLEKFDAFEDVDFGFMQRVQDQNLTFYIGSKKFEQCFTENLNKQMVFLPEFYLQEVDNEINNLTTPLHPEDCLATKPFLEFIWPLSNFQSL